MQVERAAGEPGQRLIAVSVGHVQGTTQAKFAAWLVSPEPV